MYVVLVRLYKEYLCLVLGVSFEKRVIVILEEDVNLIRNVVNYIIIFNFLILFFEKGLYIFILLILDLVIMFVLINECE